MYIVLSGKSSNKEKLVKQKSEKKQSSLLHTVQMYITSVAKSSTAIVVILFSAMYHKPTIFDQKIKKTRKTEQYKCYIFITCTTLQIIVLPTYS